LEAGRTFRKYFEHAGRLSRADVQIQVVLGEAKSRIKNEANLTWSEGIINKVKQNAVGKYVSPATIGYAVSAGGYILKKPLAGLLGAGGLGGLFGGWVTLYFTAGNPVGITPINGEIPKMYALGQSYPNPFNPSTKIKFDVPKEGNVKISVYDITGKEMKNLVNQAVKPGTYEIDFNGSNLSTGVYTLNTELMCTKAWLSEM
jgi:hypothetical protein